MAKCSKVKNAIDAKVLCGNGASQRILQKIDMHQIDYFLALTPLDEINLIAAKAAKILGAKKVIARLRNTEFNHKNAVLKPIDSDTFIWRKGKCARTQFKGVEQNSVRKVCFTSV